MAEWRARRDAPLARGARARAARRAADEWRAGAGGETRRQHAASRQDVASHCGGSGDAETAAEEEEEAEVEGEGVRAVAAAELGGEEQKGDESAAERARQEAG